jgi:WD40 repeat protein
MFEPNNTDFATLILCSAENSTAEKNREYPLLSTDRAVIGRDPNCEIALSPQEYITVSRRHAELKLITEAEVSYWTITDLGTTNGTLVNGQTITEVHPLQSGDRITLGYKGAEFLFQCQTLSNTVVAERTAIAPEPKGKAEKTAKTAKNTQPSSKTVESVKIVIPTTSLEEAYPQLFVTNKTFWNLITPQVFWELPVQEPITAIAFSRDGELLAIASKDKTIKLWHIPSQTEIITLQEAKSLATAIAFSPDRNIIASASSDKTIKLWQIETQQIIATFNGHKLAINSLAFSLDGKILASGSSDKTIKLWDLTNQTEITALTGHKSTINALTFSPDGQSLASGSNDKTIKFWNLATQKEINNIGSINTGIQYLTYNSDGNILTSLDSDRVIRLYSLADRTEILALSSPSWQNLPIAISPLGIMVAGTQGETVVKLWHL